MSTHVFRGGRGKRDLDRRIEKVGWGAFFILIGTLWLIPPGRLADGTWLVAIGMLLLVLNAVRGVLGITPHAWSTAVGALVLLAGLGLLAGYEVPIFAVLLIGLGLATVADSLLRRGRD